VVAKVIAKFNPAGAILSSVYSALTWLSDNVERFQGLADLGAKIGGVVHDVPNAKEQLAADVKSFLDGVVPVALNFGISQIPGLSRVPQAVAEALQKVRGTPLNLIGQALGKVIGAAAGRLSLTGHPEYQGLVGKPLTFLVSGESHRLWVVNRNGQSVIMRASNTGPLDLSRDLPGVSAGERARVQGDADAVTALGNQLGALLRAATAAADATRPVNAGLAGQAQSLDSRLKTAEEVLEKDLINDGAVCFGSACFAAGTPGGWRAIEALRPGDQVLSRDEHDPHGPVEAKAVEEVFVRLGSVWELRAGGRVIGTTGGHPVMCRNYVRWKSGTDRQFPPSEAETDVIGSQDG
jgi:hypothetical protein